MISWIIVIAGFTAFVLWMAYEAKNTVHYTGKQCDWCHIWFMWRSGRPAIRGKYFCSDECNHKHDLAEDKDIEREEQERQTR